MTILTYTFVRVIVLSIKKILDLLDEESVSGAHSASL